MTEIFSTSLKAGKAGEAQVAQFLLSNGYSVKDVSNDRDYQGKDIDFVATKDSADITVEVKAQKQVEHTNLIYVEEMTDMNRGNKGWRHYCQADFLFYVSGTTGYIVKMSEVNEYIDQYKEYALNFTPEAYDSNMWLGQKVVGDDFEDRFGMIYIIDLDKYARTGKYIQKVEM